MVGGLLSHLKTQGWNLEPGVETWSPGLKPGGLLKNHLKHMGEAWNVGSHLAQVETKPLNSNLIEFTLPKTNPALRGC